MNPKDNMVVEAVGILSFKPEIFKAGNAEYAKWKFGYDTWTGNGETKKNYIKCESFDDFIVEQVRQGGFERGDTVKIIGQLIIDTVDKQSYPKIRVREIEALVLT